MTDSKLETIAHIAGVLALIILGVDIYYTHFTGPDISIQSFPSEYTGIEQYDINEDIVINFKLHNSGGKTAFIRCIFIYQVTGSGNEILYSGAKSYPTRDFYIDPGETKEIKLTLPAPKARITNEFKIGVWCEPGNNFIESETVPVSWN